MWINLTAEQMTALETVLQYAANYTDEYRGEEGPEIAIVRAALEAGQEGAWVPVEDEGELNEIHAWIMYAGQSPDNIRLCRQRPAAAGTLRGA